MLITWDLQQLQEGQSLSGTSGESSVRPKRFFVVLEFVVFEGLGSYQLFFFFLILCPVAFTICPRDKTSTMRSLQSHAIASFKPGTWVPKDSWFLSVHVYPCQFYRSRSNHWQQSCWKTNNRSVLAHNACSVYLCILTAWGEGGGVWEFPALNIHPAETQTAIKT